MDRPTLTIHFTAIEPREVRATSLENELRAQFWVSIIQEHPINFIGDVSLCEDRVIRTLGAHLADQIRPHQIEQPPGPYRFLPTAISYGSLDVKIAIDGFDNLIAAFGGNAQVLVEILSQYAPDAFAASVPLPTLLRRPVRAEIVDAEWLADLESNKSEGQSGNAKTSYAAPTEKTIKKDEDQFSEGHNVDTSKVNGFASAYIKQRTDRALWLLANTSFVLPVILSLVAVYFAFKAVEAERERVERRSVEVDKRDAALREAVLARETRLIEIVLARGAAPDAAASAQAQKR